MNVYVCDPCLLLVSYAGSARPPLVTCMSSSTCVQTSSTGIFVPCKPLSYYVPGPHISCTQLLGVRWVRVVSRSCFAIFLSPGASLWNFVLPHLSLSLSLSIYPCLSHKLPLLPALSLCPQSLFMHVCSLDCISRVPVSAYVCCSVFVVR